MEMHDSYPDQFFIVTAEPHKVDSKTGINHILNEINLMLNTLFIFQLVKYINRFAE